MSKRHYYFVGSRTEGIAVRTLKSARHWARSIANRTGKSVWIGRSHDNHAQLVDREYTVRPIKTRTRGTR